MFPVTIIRLRYELPIVVKPILPNGFKTYIVVTVSAQNLNSGKRK